MSHSADKILGIIIFLKNICTQTYTCMMEENDLKVYIAHGFLQPNMKHMKFMAYAVAGLPIVLCTSKMV